MRDEPQDVSRGSSEQGKAKSTTKAPKQPRWGFRITFASVAGVLLLLATTEPVQKILSLLNYVHPSCYALVLMGCIILAGYGVGARIAERKEIEQAKQQAGRYVRVRRRFRRLKKDHELLQKEHAEVRRDYLEAEMRLQGVANCDGHWLREINAAVPRFVPQQERVDEFNKRTHIVSFFNLKGGVGKSSLASSIGHILAAKHSKSVLFIDLDFQGTLSRLCVNSQQLGKYERDEDTSDKLLTYSDDGITDLKRLLGRLAKPYAHVNGDANAAIIARHALAGVEFKREARWLIESAPGHAKYGLDARFLLRNALHCPHIFSHFDYVFLDCPPRQTTASINALACSDHVIIPVQPDQNAGEALPRTITFSRTVMSALRRRKEISYRILCDGRGLMR